MKKLKALSIILLLTLMVGCGSNTDVKDDNINDTQKEITDNTSNDIKNEYEEINKKGEIKTYDGYKVYESKSNTYGFSYPASFDEPVTSDYSASSDIVNTSNLDGITMVLPDSISSIIVTIEPMNNIKFDKYLDLSKKNMSLYMSEATLANEREATYNDINYTVLEYVYSTNDIDMNINMYITYYNNTAYIIQYTFVDGYSDDYTVEFENIINSFAFLK